MSQLSGENAFEASGLKEKEPGGENTTPTLCELTKTKTSLNLTSYKMNLIDKQK